MKYKAGGRSLADARRGRKTQQFAKIRRPRRVQISAVELTGQMTAYVQKNKVRIPVTSVSIPNADSIRELKVGRKIKASSSVLLDLQPKKGWYGRAVTKW